MICTSISLRASTRVSPGFTLLKHSSPSFGSQHVCSHSDRSPEGLRPADCATIQKKSFQPLSLSLRTGVCPLSTPVLLVLRMQIGQNSDRRRPAAGARPPTLGDSADRPSFAPVRLATLRPAKAASRCRPAVSTPFFPAVM